MMNRLSVTLFVLLLPAPQMMGAGLPDLPGYFVAGGKTGPWPVLMRTLGLEEQPAPQARVLIYPEGSRMDVEESLERLNNGALLVLEGDSPLARALGFVPTSRRLPVRKIEDLRQPEIAITWARQIILPEFRVPNEAQVFCREKRSHVPLMAGLRRGTGRVLWLAVSPGERGYERFPFVLQALMEIGLRPSFTSRRLWAFFDKSYRRDADVDQLAREWRQEGIAAIHVGAWDFFESDADSDRYLQHLIEACHRQRILVYAWLELPHVSTEFWKRHPAWREKTARLKNAHVDWRLLMNLENPDCQRAVLEGVQSMLMRFDWDGVNFAELYFDGTDGIAKPREFTPLNDDVRREVRRRYGFDPIELFNGQPRDAEKLRTFLNYRLELVARIQETWIAALETMREEKPDLDLALTHVDDRFDTKMHDAIGADAARALKLLDRYDFTFIVEDPGSVWNLGPQRYTKIAELYRPLTTHKEHLAVDINIVDREKPVYPTARQTGAELAELIHTASESFPRVIYYYEKSVSSFDAPLLSPASALVTRAELDGGDLTIESPYGVGLNWPSPVSLDGEEWPVRDDQHVWVPAGRHVLHASANSTALRVLDFNGTLLSAATRSDGVELDYESSSRALAQMDRRPTRLMIDDRPSDLKLCGEFVVLLPRGKHKVLISAN
jgi:hypothetical protein